MASEKSVNAKPAKPLKAVSVKTSDADGQAPIAHGAPLKSAAADRQSVEVTIYNDDMGLVKELRNIRIEAGEGELQFVDVPSKIRPVTVHIKPLSDKAGFAVLEQNYEYDLISHAKLMDKYVGKTIKIVEWNEYHDRVNTVDAEVLSVTDVTIASDYRNREIYKVDEVYKIDGEIYLGHPGIKVLPELPGNLISRPTLSWIYSSKATCEQPLEVSYLTRGMGWSADYILVLPADGKAGAELSGWVTVDNNSGAEFANAKLKLLAGKVNIKRETYHKKNQCIAPLRISANEAFEQSDVFEYHIYKLGRPTTLKNNQTKQISLMEAHGVNVVKEYFTSYFCDYEQYKKDAPDGATVKQAVTAYLSFKNSKENNLGSPLPAGVIRIYTADTHGSQQFIGEDRVGHTPKNENIRLKAGDAFDIVAERTPTDFKQKSAQQFDVEWQISIRNHKDEDVTVAVIEKAYGTWQIKETSHKYAKLDARTFRFDVPVGKGEEVKVKYKIRVGI